MKNLQLLYSRTADLTIKDVKYQCVGGAGRDQLILANDTEVVQLDAHDDEQPYPVVSGADVIVGLRYLSMNNELCVATEAGDVIVHGMPTGANESVTFCDGGLKTMAWSEGEDVVAFVTQSNRLVVMNCGYYPIAETSLSDTAFGEEAFVNVGWGKKETQFHGSEGKEAARKKPDQVPVDDVAQLDQRVTIAWRNDDALFAVSFVGPQGRMFKVFDKEGVLKSTSEAVTGLEAPIAWRPSGNWIAVPHVLPNKYTIGLFEKNGLRHREIVLPFKRAEEQVKGLAWSEDSNILAVYTERGAKSAIYLYTIGNYHWYQKQTLGFDGKCQTLKWTTHTNQGNVLHVVQDQRYHMYRWHFAVTRSTGRTPEDQAIVAVVDGSKVLLTNFRGAVIPPPMAAATLTHANAINRIGFQSKPSNAHHSNRFFVLDTANTISTYECIIDRNAERNTNLLHEAHLINSYTLPAACAEAISPTRWLWLNDEHVFFCSYAGLTTTAHLAKFNDDTKSLDCLDAMQLDGIVGSSTASDASDTVICQLTSGDVISIEMADSKFVQPSDPNSLVLFTLDHLSPHIDCATIDGHRKIVTLNASGELRVDDNKMPVTATSFLVTGDFLLATTHESLAFVRMADPAAGVIDTRAVERGSELVTAVPHDSRTILQMPRGNLEAIQPRVLSLCIVGRLLDAHAYRPVFDLLRKQRINLNLLVDHAPADFLLHIGAFVRDIANTQWLNLFVSDLLDEDVTATMYAGNYQHLSERRGTHAAAFDGRAKIDVVCERCCDYFDEQDAAEYLLPAITAHVKRHNFEGALALIWRMRSAEQQQQPAGQVNGVRSTTAHDALKYLLYLVNVNDLYDVALGLYDFELVLFVAQKSQKDPKEYLPFLNELKQLEENYRKFRIDNHLKRYEKALTHIVKCGVEKLDECLELIEKNGLYTSAIRLFKATDECYNDVVLQYADHLRAKGVFYEASVMYERGRDFKQAFLSAKHTLDWRRCVQLAKKAEYSGEEVEKYCLSLLPALQENGKHRDAADMAKYFNQDARELVRILCDGHLYREAVFEAGQQAAVAPSSVSDHLTEYAQQMLAKVRADHSQFNGYVRRLETVRKHKAERLLNGDDGDDDLADFDMFSDTTSMNSSRMSGGSSRHSGRSRRSSKNRRKHERRLTSLKEGNPFEDIALIDALYTLCHKIHDQQPPMRDLLQSLIAVGLDGVGVEVQAAFQQSLADIAKALDVVWIPELMVPGEPKFEEFSDYVKLQTELHYAMIKPHQRTKPILTPVDWQFEVLK